MAEAVGWGAPQRSWVDVRVGASTSHGLPGVCARLMEKGRRHCDARAGSPSGEGYVRFALVIPQERLRGACQKGGEVGI